MMAYPKHANVPPLEHHSSLRQKRRERNSVEPTALRLQTFNSSTVTDAAAAQKSDADSTKSAANAHARKRTPIISGLAFLSLLLMGITPLQASVSFSADRIEKAAENFLRKAVGPESEIESLGSVVDQHFEQEQVVARLSSGVDRRSSVRNVLVEFVHDETVLRQVMLPFRVKQFILVPSAAQNLQQGHLLQRSDIVLKRCEAHAAPRQIAEIDDLVGRKLNSDIRSGQFLDTQIAMNANGIVRGQDVILIVKRGSIEVRTRGRALADAAPGQTVRVVRQGTRDPIVTRARGGGIVELIL